MSPPPHKQALFFNQFLLFFYSFFNATLYKRPTCGPSEARGRPLPLSPSQLPLHPGGGTGHPRNRPFPPPKPAPPLSTPPAPGAGPGGVGGAESRSALTAPSPPVGAGLPRPRPLCRGAEPRAGGRGLRLPLRLERDTGEGVTPKAPPKPPVSAPKSRSPLVRAALAPLQLLQVAAEGGGTAAGGAGRRGKRGGKNEKQQDEKVRKT